LTLTEISRVRVSCNTQAQSTNEVSTMRLANDQTGSDANHEFAEQCLDARVNNLVLRT